MNRDNWTRYLIAAVLVLVVGAVWVFADEKKMKVEVRSEDGQEMTISVNGETEVISLEDLQDGESLEYEIGGLPFTVFRKGDHLTLDHDGHGEHTMMVKHFGEGDAQHVWVTEDEVHGEGAKRVMIIKQGDGTEMDVEVLEDRIVGGEAMFIGDGGHGEHEVIIMKGDEGEVDIEKMKEKFGDDFDVETTEDGKQIFTWKSTGHGESPFMVKRIGHKGAGEYVHYSCEETGSMLTVKADENLLDTYIDPATGCVMKKTEGQIRVKKIEIHKEVVED